jgi:hypothetical protein
MNRANERWNAAALATALFLGVPALDIVLGGNPSVVHGLFAACGAGSMAVWLKEL